MNPYSNYPYYYNNLYQTTKPSILSKLKPKVSWSSLLDNTSRTLNVINQAIPVINQVKPIVANAKTMLKIASIIKEDNSKVTQKKEYKENTQDFSYDSQPTFFI